MPPESPPRYCEADAATALELDAWMADHPGVTNGEVGAAVRYSDSSISQFRDLLYPGDVHTIAARVRGFLARAKARAKAIPKPPFILTAPSAKIMGVLTMAANGGRMAFLCARAGTGKTETATAYAAAHPDDGFHIDCIPGTTVLGLLGRVASALGLEAKGMSKDALFDSCVARLRSMRGPLLIVDEADHPTREALHAARMLHDKSGCGLVLLCTPALFITLRSRPNDKDAQLTSRSLYNPVIPPLTHDDVDAICAPFRLCPDAKAAAERGCQNNARRIVLALVCAAESAQAIGVEIRACDIAAAFAAQDRADLGRR